VPEPLPLEVPAEHRDGPVTLRGIRVAPGVVVGTARVVRDSEEDQLQPAEILVCETTNPSWVTLFLVAEAMVIDIGGVISHGAIAARELGIPCVINTRDGTRLLRTGDLIMTGDRPVTRELRDDLHRMAELGVSRIVAPRQLDSSLPAMLGSLDRLADLLPGAPAQ
jgi:pyruvate,water dikinase